MGALEPEMVPAVLQPERDSCICDDRLPGQFYSAVNSMAWPQQLSQVRRRPLQVCRSLVASEEQERKTVLEVR